MIFNTLICLIISVVWAVVVKFKIVVFFGYLMEVPYFCNMNLNLKPKKNEQISTTFNDVVFVADVCRNSKYG